MRKGLKATIDLLSKSNKQVILVEDNPSWTFDPFRIELAKTIPLRNKLARLMCTNCAYSESTDASIGYVDNADYIHAIRDYRNA